MLFAKNTWPTVASSKICGNSWKTLLLVIFVAVIMIYTYTNNLETRKVTLFQQEHIPTISNQVVAYLINTSKCRIPDDDPFNEDIINFLKEEKPFKCSDYDLLTYIDKSNGAVTLNVNKTLLKTYSNLEIHCCYSNITRINYETASDNEFKLTDCISFQEKVNLTFPYVQVKCYDVLKNVYTNVHATTLPVTNKTTSSLANPKFSILLVGVDSISKSSLIRTMPKTYRHLEKNMHSLKGYNKVGENTFPNLMAILTGYDSDQLLNDVCNVSVKLNKCQFIWDKFREAGYITAYAEDECSISTFNYDRPGFLEEPTDFYYHPYFLASEKLPVKKRHDMTYCTGPETSGERLFNVAKDFAISLKYMPSFGLFWANSFSHDDVNMPAVMDEPISRFLSDPQFTSALDSTIFIFFSDHGFRFGDIRYTHSGWLEERLPFIYFHIPKKFQTLFPNKFSNFLTNTERLTVPYDLFNTFQDILKIGNNSYESKSSQGCLKCYSLFSQVPENRTCEDAGIQQHWCTCKGHTYIDTNNPMVHLVSEFVVNETNKLVKSFPDGDSCSVYTLDKVRSAGVSESYSNEHSQMVNYYLVMVDTSPSAIFEATVQVSINNGKKDFILLGDIGRIDRYKPVTSCIKNGMLKKYCYCRNLFDRFKKFFSLG